MARPRSESAHRKMLDAALTLIAERGIEATSMEAIAEAARVSKATIYSHWKDKDALLLDVLAEVHNVHTRPAFATGHTRRNLVAVLAYRPEQNANMRERIMPHFLAYARRNPALFQAFREMVIEPPRTEIAKILSSGIVKGELPEDLDMELAFALLLGPMVYWHGFMKRRTENPKSLAVGVVDAFLRAFGARKTERVAHNLTWRPLPRSNEKRSAQRAQRETRKEHRGTREGDSG